MSVCVSGPLGLFMIPGIWRMYESSNRSGTLTPPGASAMIGSTMGAATVVGDDGFPSGDDT